ncbi:MAG: CPBP family intramembrane metalloprotease [Phycisphaeraceae bacterium]|nr:MAG: CPBP family intramembrane metalloprotease [Phycisphaeraceae bacterium]
MRAVVLLLVAAAAVAVWSEAAVGGVLAAPGASGEPAPTDAADGAGSDAMAARILMVFMAIAALGAVTALRGRGMFRKDAFSPARRHVGGVSALAWGLMALGMLAGASVGGMIGRRIAVGFVGDDALRDATIMGLMSAVVGLGVACLAPLLARGVKRGGFRMAPADLVIGVGALLVAIPIIWTLNVVSGWIAGAHARWRGTEPPTELAHETLRQLSERPGEVWWWAMAFVVVVASPLLEEVLYRGFLQSAVLRLTRSAWPAILITSVLFTLAHLGAADVHALPGLFALSVGMGMVFEKTGRIGAPVVMHAAFNALNLAVASVV